MTNDTTTPAPTKPVDRKINIEEDAVRLVIGLLTKQVAALHDQYFQLEAIVSEEAKANLEMTVRAIRKLENLITDLRNKLPNKIW